MIIAGGGSERAKAVRIAEETGTIEHIEFLGDIPNRELPEIYAQADIFLQPSYTEGFPRVVLEAMAARLPIVATDAGGTAELVGPLQANFIVCKDEPAAFAAATLKMIEKKTEWPEIAEENQQTVQRFATPIVAKMYLKTIFQ